MRFEDINWTLRSTGRLKRFFQREPDNAVSPLFNRVFSKSMINRVDHPGDTGPNDYPSDPGRQYWFNSLGYRSPEFGDAAMLVAGCSHSYGVGLDTQHRWGDVLSNRLGVTNANISVPGYSTSELVESIFRYIDTYGSPEYVVCLFPDLFRAPSVMVEDVVESQFSDHKLRAMANVDLSIWIGTTQILDVNPPVLSKKPHIIENIVPPENYMYQNILAIKNLETLCKSANIKLYWSTWNTDLSMIINYAENYNYKFDYYVDVDARGWDMDRSRGDYYVPTANKCHDEDYEWFHNGSDIAHGVKNSHYGSHRHLHYAEKFYEKIANASS